MKLQIRFLIAVLLTNVCCIACRGDNDPKQLEGVPAEIRFEIGAAVGHDSILFGRVNGLCVDGTGSAHVADSPGEQVRIFSAAGELLRSLGGSGGAPFEFRSVGALGCTASGWTVAVDVVARAVKVFDHEGLLKTSWQLPSGQPLRGQRGLRVLEDDRVALGIPPSYGSDGSVQWPRPLYQVRAISGEVLDTVFGPQWIAESCGNRSTRQFQSGYREDIRAAWIPKVRWTLTSNGSLAIACSSDRKIHIVKEDGYRSTLKVPEMEVPKIPPEAIEAIQQVITVERQLLSGRTVPPFSISSDQPPIADLLAGADGDLWVIGAMDYIPVELPAERPQGMPEEYWVRSSRAPAFRFDREGQFLGMGILPGRLTYRPDYPPAIEPVFRGTTLWAVTLDTLDVQRVARFEFRQWNSSIAGQTPK